MNEIENETAQALVEMGPEADAIRATLVEVTPTIVAQHQAAEVQAEAVIAAHSATALIQDSGPATERIWKAADMRMLSTENDPNLSAKGKSDARGRVAAERDAQLAAGPVAVLNRACDDVLAAFPPSVPGAPSPEIATEAMLVLARFPHTRVVDFATEAANHLRIATTMTFPLAERVRSGQLLRLVYAGLCARRATAPERFASGFAGLNAELLGLINKYLATTGGAAKHRAATALADKARGDLNWLLGALAQNGRFDVALRVGAPTLFPNTIT